MEITSGFTTDPVVQTCRDVFGLPYPFPWQRLIIASVLDALAGRNGSTGRDRISGPPSGMHRPADVSREDRTDESEPLRRIAVLPTGAGKSLCWMLPAVLSGGLTVAVFPLLSLMADQERRLRSVGVPCRILRGGQTPAERREIWEVLKGGSCRIIIANPEVLSSEPVLRALDALNPSFLVVDETHTVSQWGESFRPACAGMGALLIRWKPPAVLALTATAGPQLRERITELLFNGEPPSQALADPDRPSIRYGVLPTLCRSHTLERLIRTEPRPAIVFGSTRSSVMMMARMLRFRLDEEEIRYYHAGLTREEKMRLESWFLNSGTGVLCATCAYGMGVDKSNIRTVVHIAPPSSIEAYLQESGRASRDGQGARAWLIRTPDDERELKDLISGNKESVMKNGPGGVNKEKSGTGLFGGIESQRKLKVLQYTCADCGCRREILLDGLGIESSDCGGCDLCGGETWTEPPEQKPILRAVRWNRGRFRIGQMARILIGRRTAEIRWRGLDAARGFGTLSGWELEDAEEALRVLLRTGKLRQGRLGPWKGRLRPARWRAAAGS